MQGCVKIPDALRVILLTAGLLAGGCSSETGDRRFDLSRVDASWSNGQVLVTSRQQLALSSEARDALVHGVPLTLELELLLRDTGTQTRVEENVSSYEISYLPLSNHYQLSREGGSTVRTFPRLRHVMAELGSLEVAMATGVLPAGEYELLARIHLDRQKMPPPMRLPALLSSKWHHDSSWSSWPLIIEPEA